MFDSIIAGTTRTERLISYAIWSLLAIALTGSILSAFGICSGACTDMEKYRLFDQRFPAIGIPFFAAAMLASFFRNCARPWLRRSFDLIISGAAGAEVLFIYIQKHLIGHYCPVCLFIAAMVFLVAAFRLGEVITQLATNPGASPAKRFGTATAHIALTLSICFCGLTVAVAGTSFPLADATDTIDQDIWLGGPPAAPVEVYFVTDWFCEYCKKAEPAMESMIPAIGRAARYTFLDDPIHKESRNFAPFHASLLLNGKAHYPEGRKALQELAGKSRAPTEDMVKTAFPQFRMEEFSAVADLTKNIAGFLRAHRVTMTPSVVVRNRLTGEYRVLAGVENIREDLVLDAVKKIQKETRNVGN